MSKGLNTAVKACLDSASSIVKRGFSTSAQGWHSASVIFGNGRHRPMLLGGVWPVRGFASIPRRFRDPRESGVAEGDFRKKLQQVVHNIADNIEDEFVYEFGESAYNPKNRELFFSLMNNGYLAASLLGEDIKEIRQLSKEIYNKRYISSYTVCDASKLKFRIDIADGTIANGIGPSHPHTHYLHLSSTITLSGIFADCFYQKDKGQPGMVDITKILFRGPFSVVGDRETTLDNRPMIHSQVPLGDENVKPVYVHVYASDEGQDIRKKILPDGRGKVIPKVKEPGMFETFTPSTRSARILHAVHNGNITRLAYLQSKGIQLEFDNCTPDGVEYLLKNRRTFHDKLELERNTSQEQGIVR